eukprot:6174651-Pleurochrysis_carterae.AAC.6
MARPIFSLPTHAAQMTASQALEAGMRSAAAAHTQPSTAPRRAARLQRKRGAQGYVRSRSCRRKY